MLRKRPYLFVLALMMAMALPPMPERLLASVSSEPETSAVTRTAPAHTVAVIGDSLSIGLGKEMERVFAARQDVAFTRLGRVSSGLAKPEFFDWEKTAAKLAADLGPDVVVIMIGANDNKNILTGDGRTIYFTDPAWDAAYAARAALLVDACRAHNPQARVFWIGAPVMADATLARDLTRINAALAAMCADKAGCTFIDTWSVLADGEGRFAPLAASATGEMTAIRLDDGVHITPAGSRLLASRCMETILPAMGLDASDLGTVFAEAASLRPVAAREVASARTGTPSPAAPIQTAAPAAPAQIAAAAAIEQPAPATAPATATDGYAVLPGDSIWTIAKKLGVSPRELVQANSAIDPDRLSLGQRLNVPAKTRTAEAAPAAASPVRTETAAGPGHVLAQGDNFWSLAKRLGVRVSDLRAANPGLDPKKLQLGQRLAIPEPAAPSQAQSAPAPGQTVQGQDGATAYAVAGGDTPWTVAKRFGVSVEQLLAANGGINPKRLQIGQLLTIPAETAPDMAIRRDPRRDAEVRVPVAKGDNLWSLARRHGLRVDDLLAVNRGIDPLRLEIGSELVIPSREAAKAERERRDASIEISVRQEGSVRPYNVADGDTLWNLSKRFGISVERIIEANADVNPDRLEIGQPLNIPASVMAARY